MRGHTKMILGTLMILALVGLHPHTSQAADVESIQIVDFGIYKTAFERWEAASGTGKGKIKIVSDRKLLCPTDRISAAPGTEIGVRYEGRKMAEKSFTLQGTHQAKGLGFNG